MVTERQLRLCRRDSMNMISLSIMTLCPLGASMMMKFGCQTELSHFTCLAHAIHLNVCDVIYKEMSKQISDACCVDSNTTKNEENGKKSLEEILVNINVMKSRIVLTSFQKSKKL